jgi:hypothetical protein
MCKKGPSSQSIQPNKPTNQPADQPLHRPHLLGLRLDQRRPFLQRALRAPAPRPQPLEEDEELGQGAAARVDVLGDKGPPVLEPFPREAPRHERVQVLVEAVRRAVQQLRRPDHCRVASSLFVVVDNQSATTRRPASASSRLRGGARDRGARSIDRLGDWAGPVPFFSHLSRRAGPVDARGTIVCVAVRGGRGGLWLWGGWGTSNPLNSPK